MVIIVFVAVTIGRPTGTNYFQLQSIIHFQPSQYSYMENLNRVLLCSNPFTDSSDSDPITMMIRHSFDSWLTYLKVLSADRALIRLSFLQPEPHNIVFILCSFQEEYWLDMSLLDNVYNCFCCIHMYTKYLIKTTINIGNLEYMPFIERRRG